MKREISDFWSFEKCAFSFPGLIRFFVFGTHSLSVSHIFHVPFPSYGPRVGKYCGRREYGDALHGATPGRNCDPLAGPGPIGCDTVELADSDTMDPAEASAGLRISTIARLETMTRAVTDAAYARVKRVAPLDCPVKIGGPDPAPQPRGALFAEVDIPAEIKGRPWLRDAGRLPMPASSKEFAEAKSASPSYSPHCTIRRNSRRGVINPPPLVRGRTKRLSSIAIP